MKVTGIVRRVDDLGRIVIPKEIRRTLRIREGDPSHTTLIPEGRLCMAIHSLAKEYQRSDFTALVNQYNAVLVVLYNYNFCATLGAELTVHEEFCSTFSAEEDLVGCFV